MFEIITKGFFIGLMVSAPMGPVNMLVIQRTLNRGWEHGFVSGVGAVVSDLIYFVITMLGLSLFAVSFDKYEYIIQSFGSIILFIFGLYIYRSIPLNGSRPNQLPQETRYLKDFFSSFLLTLSNVAIILLLTGFFAHFSFYPLADGISYFVAGLTSFIFATLFWWFFLTAIVSRFRKHFNRRGLMIFNRGVGVLIMLLGAGEIIISLFPDLFK